MATEILLVEDEVAIAEPLAYLLEAEGYRLRVATHGDRAMEEIQSRMPDLILLDLMIPGVPGLDICRTVRATSDVPIIILSAKAAEVDKIVGLELGADDYVTKPYSSRELLARIKSVLRRRKSAAAEVDDELLSHEHVTLDLSRHTLLIDGQETSLPRKEFELLELLMSNSGRVMTRDRLIALVWGSDYFGDTKTLDVHIKRLRDKIEREPGHPKLIHTVRGVGYRFL